MTLMQVSLILFEREVCGVKWQHFYNIIINKISLQIWSSYLAISSFMTNWIQCFICRHADFVTMAAVVNSCNYVTWWSVKLKVYHLVSFNYLKLYSKNQNHITYNGKGICAFVVLPHKPCFQIETLIKVITISGFLPEIFSRGIIYCHANFFCLS